MGLMLLAGPYLGRETRHIALRRGDEGMSEDGLHPNDKGYQMIAEQLRSLGYEPLYPR
jgi:lysophospholipase L1-like esterase